MSNKHETIHQQLSAYLDGELAPEQAKQVAEALEKDQQLRAELKALESMRNLLRKMPRESAPPSLMDAVLGQVERNRLLETAIETSRKKPLRWMSYAATAAIVLMGLGLGIYMLSVLSQKDYESTQLAAEPQAEHDGVGVKERESTDGGIAAIPPAAAQESIRAKAEGLADAASGELKLRSKPGEPYSVGQMAAPAARNIVLLTDNLPDTETQVYSALSNANIPNALGSESSAASGQSVQQDAYRSRANAYVVNRSLPLEKELIVWVPREQVTVIANEMNRIDQANQYSLKRKQGLIPMQPAQAVPAPLAARGPDAEALAEQAMRSAEEARQTRGGATASPARREDGDKKDASSLTISQNATTAPAGAATQSAVPPMGEIVEIVITMRQVEPLPADQAVSEPAPPATQPARP